MYNLDNNLYVYENNGMNFTLNEAKEILRRYCWNRQNYDFSDLFKVFMYRIGAKKLDKREKILLICMKL